MIPSDTSLAIIFAHTSSQVSESAIQSPKEDILSVPRALAYAQATGLSSSPSISSTKHAFFSLSSSFLPSAAEVGLTCLKEVAEISPVASLSSRTSCQLLNASRKLM